MFSYLFIVFELNMNDSYIPFISMSVSNNIDLFLLIIICYSLFIVLITILS